MVERATAVLAGDVGGTTTRLGLFEAGPDGPKAIEERYFSNARFAGLDDIVAKFFDGRGVDCRTACFGLAGPVAGPRVRLTNLPWVVDAREFEEKTGIRSVLLINDLEATAWGIPALSPEALVTLNRGRPGATGNRAVIAAGTGLGEAGIFSDDSQLHPFACEGGHTGFSPTDRLTDRLLIFLRERHGTVSWERVLSGPGLTDLYRFMLVEAGRTAPEWFTDVGRHGDQASAVSAAGLDGSCEVAVRTLRLFARLYGDEAANLSLKLMATGGVWIGGGIAPKILPVLEGGAFLEGFLAKGRMRPVLESIPVRVILDDRAALLGAARRAAIV
jgi:glucokinase